MSRGSPRGKQSYEEIERQLRILKAREREWEETYSGPSDAEGVALRPALSVLQHKNFTAFTRLVDVLPRVPNWRPRGADGSDIPGSKPLGFHGAVEFARVHVAAAIDAIWFSSPRSPAQVQNYHRAKGWLTPPFVYWLIRPDYQGFEERVDLKACVEAIGLAESMREAFFQSQETVVDPIEAEKRGFR